MAGKRIHLFRLFGFAVNVDTSWFILALFVTWSLARGVFPEYFKGYSTATYWWMGAAGALGLFASIIFHEFCHSVVAVRYGLPMKGITLFIFGGVAEMSDEPPSPKAEFLMAVAGPVSSVVLGAAIYLLHKMAVQAGWPRPVNGVMGYLAYLNFALAIFNMLPAFPLDGGRVLRSILWGLKKNIRWATKIASRLGSWFGVFMMVVGGLNVFTDNFLGGVWLFLIGMFLRRASQTSYQQLLMRRSFEGEPVWRFMESSPVTVPASISLEQLVEDYFYRYYFKMFPVVQDGKLVGCVTSQQIKEIPKQQWGQHTVAEVAVPCSPGIAIGPDSDATEALSLMGRTGNSRLLVVDNGVLVGVVTLKDMLKFLALKVDFEGEL